MPSSSAAYNHKLGNSLQQVFLQNNLLSVVFIATIW